VLSVTLIAFLDDIKSGPCDRKLSSIRFTLISLSSVKQLFLQIPTIIISDRPYEIDLLLTVSHGILLRVFFKKSGMNYNKESSNTRSDLCR